MRILFLFIGEPHQLFHAAPIAAELCALSPDTDIEIALAGKGHLACLDRVQTAYPDFRPTVRLLAQSGPARWLQQTGILKHPRMPVLVQALPYLRSFDAIIVPERTTTAIRHLLPARTRLIFTPHGAGDRAIMLDPRDRHFDFVLVAGEKSERRLLDAGTIRPGHYAVNGYVKLDLMQRLQASQAPLFDNERQTVLYAPHFRRTLSSWDRFGSAVMTHFAAQDSFNLIVAPHVRLFADASYSEVAKVMAAAVPGKIIVDPGSDRLFDMSYTGSADIYLGDVSSQVYEFLHTPKPCIFLNAHGADWEENPDYHFWSLGDVIDDPNALPAALAAANQHHARYADAQRAAFAESVGGNPAGAARRGARAITEFLARGDQQAMSVAP